MGDSYLDQASRRGRRCVDLWTGTRGSHAEGPAAEPGTATGVSAPLQGAGWGSAPAALSPGGRQGPVPLPQGVHWNFPEPRHAD